MTQGKCRACGDEGVWLNEEGLCEDCQESKELLESLNELEGE